ncbi:pentatricopeptide repeat-containing protein At4g17616 [Hibiscus syriacus]|uniref:pentatricopeptide repeat-containing protein At4g17616 n=1 Tax=Hibiscus syriacus TaxID=106335 RepID=UPI0019220345|nr:pentatricopeptide repeat-containing protein At4g17616 [Hibiscus syriacus]
MAIKLTRKIFVNPCFISYSSTRSLVALNSNHGTGFFLSKFFDGFDGSGVLCRPRFFCSATRVERLSWEGSSHVVLLTKLENALKDLKLDEAWETFNDFKRSYGFPNHLLVSRFITLLSYSSSPHWLLKACDLVMMVLKDKLDHLRPGMLIKLVLSLARAQMPIPLSMILRLMLEKRMIPPMNVLHLLFLHMVKTEVGACIASNLLVQICDSYIRFCSGKSHCPNLLKPDTMIFNLVLDSCARFAASLRGQQIIELMSQTGVVADAHTIIIIAQIHEMNGQRDELKKFKDHVATLSVAFVSHYRQFFECLLNLHFKFDDIDSAAELLLRMNRSLDSHPMKDSGKDYQKPCFVPIGPQNLRNGLKIQIVPELMQKDSVLKAEGKSDLVFCRDKKLLPSNRALSKLINGYKRHGKIDELSKFLLGLKKELDSSGQSSLFSEVIDACISLGWMEIAHDILDDMESSGDPLGASAYEALLTAYNERNMFREGNVLLKQIRKAGLVMNVVNNSVMSKNVIANIGRSSLCIKEPSSICQPTLSECLVHEVSDSEKAISPITYELNSSIYFFCKAKMMGDALNIYRRMQKMKIQPTEHTYMYLVCGYSSLEMYRDISILWGDMKRITASRNFTVSCNLYEVLLLNFLRGGYFERVMEVIGYMNKCNMYIDKWVYKNEYLKFHKNLYRSLKASKTRTEAQGKRLEHVQAFKKWAAIS